MRATPFSLFLFVILAFALMSCEWFCKKSTFTGKVISNAGTQVADAEVTINKKKTATDKNGNFALKLCSHEKDFLVTVRKFGFGLFSNRFDTAFVDRTIFLTQGTIIEFDPTKKNILRDRNSSSNPFKPALLTQVDTAQLFGTIPSVYDKDGKFVAFGYPGQVQRAFDYLRMPVRGSPGIEIGIPENSLVDEDNKAPEPGKMLKAALSTVDFFNPDGMPGDFIVNTSEGIGYMESFGAGTIEISDGKKTYKLKKGATASVKFPVYPIRLQLKERLEQEISLLRYNEIQGVWEETGDGTLNKEGNAYEGTVDRFSVLNMDIIKTGPSKCFKIRQVVRNGTADNSNNFVQRYKAHVVVPATATSFFKETTNPFPIDEASSQACVPVNDTKQNSDAFTTRLHAVTRIPMTVPNIIVVFIDNTTSDVLGISIGTPNAGSIPGSTAVTQARTCSTACDAPACDATIPSPAHDFAQAASSNCNTNATCWMAQCGFIPFENLGSGMRVVAAAMGGGKVKIKWQNTKPITDTSRLRISVFDADNCGGTRTVILNRCTGGSACVPVEVCADGDCGLNQCKFGELIYPATGTATGPVSVQLEFWDNVCSPTSVQSVCSNNITVI